jgi:hypothetical protein
MKVPEEMRKKRIQVIDDVLKYRQEKGVDRAAVTRALSAEEVALYDAATPLFSQAGSGGYVYDQRHVDFSSMTAAGIATSQVERNILVPGIIFHDSGRYLTPEGVTTINHSSFSQRLIHQLEGMKLVQRNLSEQNYDIHTIRQVARIVAVHDWNAYVIKFDADEELRQFEDAGNPRITYLDGQISTLRETYNFLNALATDDLLESSIFKYFSDVDRLNVPAAGSAHKDFWGRQKYESMTFLDFIIGRAMRFDLLDTTLPVVSSSQRKIYAPSKLNEIDASAGRSDLYTGLGVAFMERTLKERVRDAETEPFNDSSITSESVLAESFNRILDRENKYMINFANKK